MIIYSLVFFVCIALDRLTKMWALATCTQPLVLNQVLSCDVVVNRGISLSLFDGNSAHMFILVTIIVTLIITCFAAYTIVHAYRGNRVFPHIVILAGAISNMIDRVQYHGVIDFISLHYSGWYFPIFNIADMCIVLGVLGLLCYEK